MAYSEFGTGDRFFSPTMLAENLVDENGGYARGPERALLSALLFDGIQSFMNYACAESKEVRNRYLEAYNWVARRGTEYVFSFDSVCEALGVNAEYFRLGLLDASSSQHFEWTKKRRNF